MWNSLLMSKVVGKSLKKKVLLKILGKTGPNKCLYCDLQTCERFKELNRVHLYRHVVFEWVSSYKFPHFPLRNATFLIFAKDVTMAPIKYI